jgi:hypothetical protein
VWQHSEYHRNAACTYEPQQLLSSNSNLLPKVSVPERTQTVSLHLWLHWVALQTNSGPPLTHQTIPRSNKVEAMSSNLHASTVLLHTKKKKTSNFYPEEQNKILNHTTKSH